MGPAIDGAVDFTVRGECMRPLTSDQSVSVRRQWFYLPGDVVVIRRRDHFSIHRFLGYAVSTHGLLALTQADDNALPDPPAKSKCIVGRAWCEVRWSDRTLAVGRYARAIGRRIGEVTR